MTAQINQKSSKRYYSANLKGRHHLVNFA